MTQHKQGNIKLATKLEMTFIETGFTNWKKAMEKFKDHENSSCHREAIHVSEIPERNANLPEIFDSKLTYEKFDNRQAFLEILESIRYLGRQGLPLRGHDDSQGNVMQLMMSKARNNSKLKAWLEKKKEKYNDHHIQNEILKIMSLSILRDIAKNIECGAYYTIMADEVTDAANHEQFVLCLRWVDDELNPHEEFICLQSVPNISADTLVAVIRDVLIRMNLSIINCRGQCYDGASNMVGAKSGVATQIKNDEPRAILTHCYGHVLQLAVGDTVKEIKLLGNTLDTTYEISKLLKFSPKRDALFDTLKITIAPDCPGFRTLCPTRWTVRAACLQSVLENWEVLRESWTESLETKLDPEVKSRITGVRYQMETFDYFYGVQLGNLVLRHSDNLSRTIQKPTLSAGDCQSLAKLSLNTMQKLRNDESFDLLWSNVNSKADELEIGPPELPRKRKRPARFDSGIAEHEFPTEIKTHYRQIYFETLDTVMSCLEKRFLQGDYVNHYQQLENLLFNAVKGVPFQNELSAVCDFYQNDLDKSLLETQLLILHTKFSQCGDLKVPEIVKGFCNLAECQQELIQQVKIVIKLWLLTPATNAVSERSSSAVRRICTYLRTRSSQERFNNCMVLSIHKDKVDTLNLVDIVNEFCRENDQRIRHFARFHARDQLNKRKELCTKSTQC